jgi:hypothetical protein
MQESNMDRKTKSATRSRMMRFVAITLSVLAMVVLCNVRVGAQVEEHEAKAAFLLKLVNFVEWPSGAGQGSLIIGMVGADETSEALQRLAAGKTVNGKQLVVKRLAADADMSSCQVLYIGSSQAKNLASLLDKARNASVLTVGEAEGFGQKGGVVNLLISDGRIKFEVNPHAAERAHLQISSRLLSLATIVNGG